MPDTLHLDVYFDFVCPWCLIGKQHLQRALARLADSDPDVRVQVLWHSVQLIPQVPPGGWPYAEFYERRLGGQDAVKVRQAQVMAAAARAGATIDFASIATFPNTGLAHRLMTLGKAQLDPAGQERLLDRLFAAYFQRGEDIGDMHTLAQIAAEAGLDPSATREALTEGAGIPQAPAVPGVPYFVFNRRYAVSGAHPADELHAAMRQALARAAPDVARAQRG